MTQQKSLTVLLLGLALAIAVNSTVPTATEQPYCPVSNGDLTVDVIGTQTDDYDIVGNFYESATDNTQDVYIKKGNLVSNANFKLTSYTDEGAKVTAECADSAGLQFLWFSKGLLLLSTANGATYSVCLYTGDSATTTLTRKDIEFPSAYGFGTFDEFVPFYYEDSTKIMYVGIRKGTDVNYFKYNILLNVATITASKTAIQNGVNIVLTTPASIKGLTGTGTCYNNGLDRIINCIVSGMQWGERTTIADIQPTDSFQFLPIASENSGVLVLAADSLSGHIALFNYTKQFTSGTAEATITLPTGTTKYQTFSDEISSFIVYSDAAFVWVNLDYDIIFRYAKLEGADVIDLSTATDMSLSSNKFVVLYADSIDYYRITGTGSSGTIEKLFSKSYNPDDISLDGSYRFTLSCMCGALRRFSCVSSTLGCLLIKSAGVACGDKDLPAAAQTNVAG